MANIFKYTYNVLFLNNWDENISNDITDFTL